MFRQKPLLGVLQIDNPCDMRRIQQSNNIETLLRPVNVWDFMDAIVDKQSAYNELMELHETAALQMVADFHTYLDSQKIATPIPAYIYDGSSPRHGCTTQIDTVQGNSNFAGMVFRDIQEVGRATVRHIRLTKIKAISKFDYPDFEFSIIENGFLETHHVPLRAGVNDILGIMGIPNYSSSSPEFAILYDTSKWQLIHTDLMCGCKLRSSNVKPYAYNGEYAIEGVVGKVQTAYGFLTQFTSYCDYQSVLRALAMEDSGQVNRALANKTWSLVCQKALTSSRVTNETTIDIDQVRAKMIECENIYKVGMDNIWRTIGNSLHGVSTDCLQCNRIKYVQNV